LLRVRDGVATRLELCGREEGSHSEYLLDDGPCGFSSCFLAIKVVKLQMFTPPCFTEKLIKN